MLLVIFLISLTYFILATYSQYSARVVDEEDIVSPVQIEEILKTVKPIHQLESHDSQVARGSGSLKQNSSTVYTCRNSVQGRQLVADENGYICDRFDLQVNGCCRIGTASTKRYVCNSCSEAGCCALYEQCVSCCLHPQKVCILLVWFNMHGT